MYILLDLEWVKLNAGKIKLTQISAIRTKNGNTWDTKNRFDILVKPKISANCDWTLSAYNGHSPEEYYRGEYEAVCIKKLFDWIEPGDCLIFWEWDAYRTLEQIYKKYYNKDCFGHKVTSSCLKSSLNEILGGMGVCTRDLYEQADCFAVDEPAIRHCAHTDIELMQAILINTDIRPKEFDKAQRKKKILYRRTSNEKAINKSTYMYIYAPDSDVFHRNSCKLILNANIIMGCSQFNTAIQERRPCKICNPEPEAAEAMVQAKWDIPDFVTGKTDIIETKLYGGKIGKVSRANVVGYCNYSSHAGALTKYTEKQHRCAERGCYYFEKVENASFGVNHKAQLKSESFSRLNDNILKRLLCQFQSFADQYRYPLQIVRLEQIQENVFYIYYVSAYGYADGGRYPKFLEAIRRCHPNYIVTLRHLRADDGHFLTFEEYNSSWR